MPDSTTLLVGTEQWLSVVGWEGYYEVSDRGRVRSVDRVITDVTGKAKRLRGKVLVLSTSKRGYVFTNLSRDAGDTSLYVHRMVLTAFVGPCPEGMECCHGPGGTSNNTLSNIRGDTKAANAADQLIQGTNWQSNKTVCPRGHRLIAPNLVEWQAAIGRRSCQACVLAHACCNNRRRHGRPVPDFKEEADHRYRQIMSGLAASQSA